MDCRELANGYNWSAGDETCTQFAFSTGNAILQVMLYGLGIALFFLAIAWVAFWFITSVLHRKGAS